MREAGLAALKPFSGEMGIAADPSSGEPPPPVFDDIACREGKDVL